MPRRGKRAREDHAARQSEQRLHAQRPSQLAGAAQLHPYRKRRTSLHGERAREDCCLPSINFRDKWTARKG